MKARANWNQSSHTKMAVDAFSKCHPAVNFIFFMGAIGCGVVFQHPAYVLAGIFGAAIYYLLLMGMNAVKRILLFLPFALVLTLINPLFNTQGKHILFHIFGRPYTGEALMYGASLSGVLLVMIIWFGCYNTVMTSDKFASLFGNLIPSVSLLLVMVFRMVPNLIRKTGQIIDARRSIGKGAGEADNYQEKLNHGMTVLSAMTSWVLEGSLVTADSMRSRGYGAAKRQSFMIYRMGVYDKILLVVQTILVVLVIAAAGFGQANVSFTPEFSIAPVSWGLVVYSTYLLIPTVLYIKEAVQWHISRSTI